MEKKKIHSNFTSKLPIIKIVLVGIVAIGIILDAAVIQRKSDAILFFFLLGYIFLVWKFKISSQVTHFLLVCVLSITFIHFLRFGAGLQAEKSATWLFFLLFITLVQQTKE